MKEIKVAIVGVGNCASSLIQGLTYYRKKPQDETPALMHWQIGGYEPGDIRVVAAFDIDRRKVGQDLSRAIFAPPNCTRAFCPEVPAAGVTVRMGQVHDGIAAHMSGYDEERRFCVADTPEPAAAEIVSALRDCGARILVNYLPVGSEQAVRFYARCALDAGLAFINNMPVFIASDPAWAARFAERGLPVIGDDIKSQLGATISHRVLAQLFRDRGVKLDRTYQVNMGGNTDFLNMLERSRLTSKKASKTEAVQSVLAQRLDPGSIHIGPSDYIPFLNDNKVCYLRMEGRLFGDVPMSIEMRLSVEDSPNSAGVAIDAIRCCQLALDRGRGGVLHSPAAYFMKHPPRQFTDDCARDMVEAFIAGERED